MRLVGYCRVSTDGQAERDTTEIQRQALREYAEAQGHELAYLFEDEGISGAKDLENRPGLSEMFDYLEQSPDIAGVLIFKLDRLARDLYLQEHMIRKLKDMGKTLISIKEPDICGNDPMRTAFRQFMGIVAELEKSFITMRMTAGRLSKARKGGYAGGSAALGYKVENGDLTRDEEGLETVRTIFSMRDRGETLREIAGHLNSSGVPTAKGGSWYASTVRHILNNPLYAGTLRYSTVLAQRPELAVI